jgi:hypothetical protein
LSSLTTGRGAIHSRSVTVDELRKPEVASALEWCFLAALASHITYDRVVPLPENPPPQLENKDHEKLATALGDLFVEHVQIFREQRVNNSKKPPDVPDEQVIRGFARYMYPRSGNVYENGNATGAFAKELQRALEDPTGVQFIAATSPDMPNCVLGLATCEHYTLEDQKTGLYIRELMISPFHRSSTIVRTLVDEIMKIAMMGGNQPGVDSFRLNGRTAMLEKEDESASLTVFLNGGSMLKFEMNGSNNADTLKKFASGFKIADIEKHLKG